MMCGRNTQDRVRVRRTTGAEDIGHGGGGGWRRRRGAEDVGGEGKGRGGEEGLGRGVLGWEGGQCLPSMR